MVSVPLRDSRLFTLIKSTLSNLLPSSVKHRILRFYHWYEVKSVEFFSKNRLLAGFYYAFLNRRFDREHLAVLKGRKAYYRSLNELGASSPLLRRNVHRLEKGLIMRPRRDAFGEAFILETVNILKRAQRMENFCHDELRWASDVLDDYFDIVKDTPIIYEARLAYVECSNAIEKSKSKISKNEKFKPYPLSSIPDTSISFEQITALFHRRRSVRWYKQIPVPLDLIQKVINVASLAPSACNRQPFRFIVVNEPDEASRISECAGGTSGFAHQLPAVIVVVGDLSAYPKERDRHLIYIDASLASMQLMLAAETLGLSTCPINWPDIDRPEKQLQKLLKLQQYERVIMLISIGYGDPEGGIPFSQKKHDLLITEVFHPRGH